MLLDDLGDNVGVEDDHASKTGPRGKSARGGRSRSTPPSTAKRAWIRLPRPTNVGCLDSDSRTMARTSASIERPLRATRTRSWALVSCDQGNTSATFIASS